MIRGGAIYVTCMYQIDTKLEAIHGSRACYTARFSALCIVAVDTCVAPKTTRYVCEMAAKRRDLGGWTNNCTEIRNGS